MQTKLIDVCKVTCPDCGCKSYAFNSPGCAWDPDKCPDCGLDLGSYADGDLQVEDKSVEITVNRLTGQLEVVPEAPTKDDGLFRWFIGTVRIQALLAGRD